MEIFGKRLFGTLTIFFARLHYRYEVIPHAKKLGRELNNVKMASTAVQVRMIHDEWYRNGGA